VDEAIKLNIEYFFLEEIKNKVVV